VTDGVLSRVYNILGGYKNMRLRHAVNTVVLAGAIAASGNPLVAQTDHQDEKRDTPDKVQRRIEPETFRRSFGKEHTFRIKEGNSRFRQSGYDFRLVDPWPQNWTYDQDVYVEMVNGTYFLCNTANPGVNVQIMIE
jgi:hypothetical protein